MKILLQSAAAVAVLAPMAIVEPASASEWYVKASVGQSEASVEGIDLSDDLAYGAGIGTSVGPVRVEAGVSRLSGNLMGFVDADALDYHATAYLDLAVGENASVFGGVGLDYIDAEATSFGTSIDASGQGWHYAAGFAYRLNSRMIAEAQYRHIEADLDADFIGDVSLEADEMTFGVRLAL